jgi:hypothetical protein
MKEMEFDKIQEYFVCTLRQQAMIYSIMTKYVHNIQFQSKIDAISVNSADIRSNLVDDKIEKTFDDYLFSFIQKIF